MKKDIKITYSGKGTFTKMAFWFVTLFLFFSSTLFGQGYNIKIKISTLKDSTIILGHHFGGMYYPDDTVKLDNKGQGSFKGAKSLPTGMYFIFLPTKKTFDVILSEDQTFNIEIDTSEFVKTAKISGSTENELYFNYLRFIGSNTEHANALVKKKKISNSDTQKDSITKALDKINKEVLTHIDELIKNNSTLFFGKFLLAIQDVKVPDPPRNTSGKITDSTFQYHYYKAHYFDNFDYTNPGLLRTPIYEKKIKDYIEKVVPQIPDSINKEIDIILDKAKKENEVFRYLLVTFFNNYAQSQIMGFDAIFVHISEKYYIPNATWADKDYIEKLKKEVAKRKPNLIGNVAPNLKLVEVNKDHFLAAKTDTALKSNPYVGNFLNIHDVQAKFTVLVFWEADCGHCKKAIPKLHEIYETLKNKDVKIIAVHMISSVEGKRKWIDFVNENSLYDWINVWSPYSNEFRDQYDVYSTPVIYVLDKSKRIIAKRIGAEQVPEIIDFELKKEVKK
jgi:thiol-disulfide isomerase/thioredoxin